MKSSLVRQIIELENKSSAELREMYNSLFEIKCKHNAHKDSLRHKIAYRLQELALGGLSQDTASKLERMADLGDTKTKKSSDLLPGTKIRKQYKDTMYEVEVLENGFECGGQKFNSLSAIAKYITGTKWNGPKFFGLRTL